MGHVHEKAKGRSTRRERGEQKGDTRGGTQDNTRGRRRKGDSRSPREAIRKMGREMPLPVPRPQSSTGYRVSLGDCPSTVSLTTLCTYHITFSQFFFPICTF